LEYWNNGLCQSVAMHSFGSFFLKTKFRIEIIPFKKQHSTIPSFH
jgi:hypothetical protein